MRSSIGGSSRGHTRSNGAGIAGAPTIGETLDGVRHLGQAELVAVHTLDATAAHACPTKAIDDAAMGV